jgi:very-short-patch-repair endonuclease
VPAEDFPHGDPRGELLRACTRPQVPEAVADDLEARCETDLERQVLRRIVARGYQRVKVQHVVGQYRIDIVVEGPDRRLAIECDGDAARNIDTWEADRARQAVLERAGWTFERIAGSAYFRDPETALQPLWHRLDDLAIPATPATP